MKHLRRLVAACVQLMVVVPFGAVAARADSIGVYPARLEFGEVGRSGFGLQVLVIENGSARTERFTLESDGVVGRWVSFHADRAGANDGTAPITAIDIEPGSRHEVYVRLDAPTSASNGRYEGLVRIRQDDPMNTSGVTLGAEIPVGVTVEGVQRLAGALVSVEADPTEEDLALALRVRVRNTGNVVLVPELVVRVLDGDQVIDSLLVADSAVDVGDEAIVAAVVTLEGVPAGEYVLQVRGTAAGTDLGVVETPLSIAERGTFTRSGQLDELTLRGEPRLGAMIEIEGRFLNTGAISTLAMLHADVYRGDVLVANLDSPPRRVAAGGAESLSVFVPVKDEGRYRIVAHVVYDGDRTTDREVGFGVGGGGSVNTPALVVATGAGIGLVAAGAAVAARSSRRRHTDHAS